MRLRITFFSITIVVFLSCNSLKKTNNNDVAKTTEVVKKEDVIINQVAEEVKIEETISQNSAPALMVMLTQQQQQLGKDLYENKCANCHNLYDTKTFSTEQWKPILLRMQLEANIEDIDRENIFAYVTMQ